MAEVCLDENGGRVMVSLARSTGKRPVGSVSSLRFDWLGDMKVIAETEPDGSAAEQLRRSRLMPQWRMKSAPRMAWLDMSLMTCAGNVKVDASGSLKASSYKPSDLSAEPWTLENCVMAEERTFGAG